MVYTINIYNCHKVILQTSVVYKKKRSSFWAKFYWFTSFNLFFLKKKGKEHCWVANLPPNWNLSFFVVFFSSACTKFTVKICHTFIGLLVYCCFSVDCVSFTVLVLMYILLYCYTKLSALKLHKVRNLVGCHVDTSIILSVSFMINITLQVLRMFN